jgi:hypothetical protein
MILLRLFKDNRSKGIAWMIFLLAGLYLPSFIRDLGTGGSAGWEAHTAMPFYQMIFGQLHHFPVLNHIISMALVILIGYLMIRIAYRDQLLKQRSLMPAMFFMLFSFVIPAARELSPTLLASLFYLLCFSILFKSQDKKPDTLAVFQASLVLALGSMFCLKIIWFLPLLWVCLWTIRQVTWRELLHTILAFVIMGLLLFTWFWGIKDDGGAFKTLIAENMALTGSFQPLHYSAYLLYGFMLILVGIASIHMVRYFPTRKTTVQNIYQVLFYMFLAGTAYFILIAHFDPASLTFIAIPVSFVLSDYFHRKKSPWIHEMAMWILLGLVLYVQLML